jgi:hypothetical protein
MICAACVAVAKAIGAYTATAARMEISLVIGLAPPKVETLDNDLRGLRRSGDGDRRVDGDGGEDGVKLGHWTGSL